MLIILKKKKDFQQIVWSKNENNMKTKIVSLHIHLTDTMKSTIDNVMAALTTDTI